MVLEDLLNKIGKRKVYSFFLGILYVLISYGTAVLFFPENISLAMIFFTTILLVPSTARLVNMEEKIETQDGMHHFIRDHYVIMEIFMFLFLGIFAGYLIAGTYSGNAISDQMSILSSQNINITQEMPKVPQLEGILTNNISVAIVAFVLSIFFGVGALFLIVRNASIVSAFVIKISQTTAQQMLLSAGIFSLHFIPEVIGFLLAALAGGVISKAITKEGMRNERFRNVIKDGTILLLFALLFLILAAVIEVFITPGLFRMSL